MECSTAGMIEGHGNKVHVEYEDKTGKGLRDIWHKCNSKGNELLG